MELELNLAHLNCYDTILDDIISQEETMETIVPDACPDILRIVDTEGVVLLTGKEIKEGRAEISGVVKATVIYLPDGIKGLRRMEVTIPFKTAVERAAIKPPCKLVISPRIRNTDTRMLNPRKILTRVDIAAAAKILAPRTAAVCSEIQHGEKRGMQQRHIEQDAYMITAVQEKHFTFSDNVNISGSKPGAEELLKHRTELWCNESKIIGNKLIFKGEVNLQILYRAFDDTLGTASFTLPFSQIMEVAGVEEEADILLDFLFSEVNCTLTGGEEGRTIAVTLGMVGQAVVREVRRVQMLSDAYSTMYEHRNELLQYEFDHLESGGTNRLDIREQLETELPVKTVCDTGVIIGQLSQIWEGDTVRLVAELSIHVVYLAEDGSAYSASRRTSAECELALRRGCTCSFVCNTAGERLATLNADGLEVRFPLDFRYLALSSRRVTGVSNVTVNENAMRDTSRQPSVILRMVEQGEGLWEIAKIYATTTGDIMQANNLAEEEVPAGRLLLIPKKR